MTDYRQSAPPDSQRGWLAQHKVTAVLGAVIVLILVLMAVSSSGSGGFFSTDTTSGTTSSTAHDL